jgi:hypothetical protein
MVRLISQHDMDAAQTLSEAELIRLRARISELVSQALQAHGKQPHQNQDKQNNGNALMGLYGVLHSDIPKASDEEVSASIAKHIAQENQRPGG